jgi:hypothetical protein
MENMTYINDLPDDINQSLTISGPCGILGYPARKQAGETRTMLPKLARMAFLLVLAGMVVSWAVSASKSKAPEPQTDQPTWRMYS